MSLSVVVPVYNSAGTLDELIRRLDAALADHEREYILVNDGSEDDSWAVIEQLAERCCRVLGVNLMRNYGQHNALLCGIRKARFDVIVTLDDDLQNPPEEIPRLLTCLQEGHDVVYGTPEAERHGLWRDLASRLTKAALASTMGASVAKNASSFRVFTTQLREAFSDFESPFVSIDVLLGWGTTRFGWLRVRHDVRTVGASNYTFSKLVGHALNMLTGFSTRPLRLASIVGFTFTLFGVFVLLYVVGRYVIQGSSVSGFPFLASTLAIFSGTQLFALGIIGEYLARVHTRSMQRPVYAVRGVVGTPPTCSTATPT